jgi:hypothetical protein
MPSFHTNEVLAAPARRSLEHESPQFVVDAIFNSSSALKHACTHAALLDVFEFNTVKSDSYRYTFKCKDEDCAWY